MNFKKNFIFISNIAFFLLSYTKHISFKKAVGDVVKTQQRVLFGILKKNSFSEYGVRFGFSSISSVADFKNRVSITNYEDYLPYIETLREKKDKVLTGRHII